MSFPLGGGAVGGPPMPIAGSAEDQGVKAVRTRRRWGKQGEKANWV